MSTLSDIIHGVCIQTPDSYHLWTFAENHAWHNAVNATLHAIHNATYAYGLDADAKEKQLAKLTKKERITP